MLKLMYNGNTVTCGGGFVSFPDPAHFVTLIQNTGGTIAADKASGVPGDIVTLSNTPSVGYNFDNYSITGATLTGSQFEFGNSDVSAEGLFSRKAYTLTLQNDGHGTISATKTTGYAGDTVTLSNSYNTYYRFNNYTQSAGSLNGSTFTFGNADATAKANFKVNNFFASGRFTHITNPTASGNRSVKSDFYAYKTYTSGNASIPAGFYVTKTSYQSGNKIGNKTASTTNAWNPTGTISAYKWSGYCDTDAFQRFILSKNYLSTRSHHLVVGSTNFGSTGGTVPGTTKGTTKLTNWGSTTTLGQVHCTAQLTTTATYDHWMTNQAYTTANSIWWASGYLP